MIDEPKTAVVEAKLLRTGVVKRSLVIAGHRTSISLEQAFWNALKALAERRSQSINALVAEIDAERAGANLSSAIRVFLFQIANRQ
jgi:predicted DNA-binding ribbon-helix-helix protein